MSYLSLARKYRPRRFVDMVGQEATTLALTNALRLNRAPRSVIFTGVRGVGKTTTARIYAKALNCEAGPTADPCDTCESCLAIQSGSHEDVLEIDGASHTGVDDVRALQETLAYVPQRSSFKIYMIDEVHMLSISAFNALLKTLEEPPEHVVFIFATTELHKVPETIQSRCLTFHLQKIQRQIIAARLQSILDAEAIPYEEAALQQLAKEGRGSLRDALTLLDQAIAMGDGAVSSLALQQMLGKSDSGPIHELLAALVNRDAAAALEIVAHWDQEGLALEVLVEELAKSCRDAFILRDNKAQGLALQLLDLESKEQQNLLEIGRSAAMFDLNRLFRSCVKCLDDLHHADLDRFIVENYFLEWCLDPGLPEMQKLPQGGKSTSIQVASETPHTPVATPLSAPAKPQSGEPQLGLKDRWKQNQAIAQQLNRPAAPKEDAKQTLEQRSDQHAVGRDEGAAEGKSLGHGDAAERAAAAEQVAVAERAAAERAAAERAVAAEQAAAAERAAADRAAAERAAAERAAAERAAADRAAAERAAAERAAAERAAADRAAADRAAAERAAAERAAAERAAAERAAAERAAATEQAAAAEHTSQEHQIASSLGNQSRAPLAEIGPEPTESKVGPLPSPRLTSLPKVSSSGRLGPRPAALATHSPRLANSGLSQGEAPSSSPPPVQEEPSPAFESPQALAVPPSEEALSAVAIEVSTPSSLAPLVAEELPAALPRPPSHGPMLPASWREFVEAWKKEKPLQARVVEETYVLAYGPECIRLAVDPASMAGGKLLQLDMRKRFLAQFEQLFGFHGQLEVVPREASGATQNSVGLPQALGESLLEVKQKEREIARGVLKQRLEEHPLTREVISKFGGTIENIELA